MCIHVIGFIVHTNQHDFISQRRYNTLSCSQPTVCLVITGDYPNSEKTAACSSTSRSLIQTKSNLVRLLPKCVPPDGEAWQSSREQTCLPMPLKPKLQEFKYKDMKLPINNVAIALAGEEQWEMDCRQHFHKTWSSGYFPVYNSLISFKASIGWEFLLRLAVENKLMKCGGRAVQDVLFLQAIF